jgi:hypothetical protein
MKTPSSKPTRWCMPVCGLVLAGLLSACGASSNYDEPAPPPVVVDDTKVPASATVSVSAYASYTGSLAKSETKSPLDVNAVVPPTSETEAPMPM